MNVGRRGSGLRLLLGVSIGLVILAIGAGGVAWASFRLAAPIRVEVRETGGDETNLSLRVPAVLVEIAVAAAPDSVWSEVGREAGPFLAAAAAAVDALARCEDGVYVEVEGPDEHVRIEKRHGSIRVLVDAPDTRVRAEMPLRTARAVLARIAASASAAEA